MSEIPVHQCSLPECKTLADLESVTNDLRLVVDISGRLIAGEKDVVLMRSLFSAGLITYRRCYNSGVRNGLNREDLGIHFQGHPKEMHDYLIAQANKLIAHSVNPFEHTQVGALVQDGAVVGIASLSAQLTMFNEPQMEQWHRLAKQTLEMILLPKIEAARKVALEAVGRLAIEDITRQPRLEYDPKVAPEKASTRR